MDEAYVKRAAGGLRGEAQALRWLAEAESSGGIAVARVISASDTELATERVHTSSPTAQMARAAGRALAHTHESGAAFWGAPPSGWSGAYLLSGTESPCADEKDAPSSWGAYFANYRIRPYLNQLSPGFFRDSELARFDELLRLLEAGELSAPQPALVGDAVARVHGDLWAGNLLWSANSPTGAVVIDPMAHGGHAEEDLAMLALFGCAYLSELLDAYNDASPLGEGWRERVSLMQLPPLLHHCLLFGSSYRAETLIALARYV